LAGNDARLGNTAIAAPESLQLKLSSIARSKVSQLSLGFRIGASKQ
jgi:hypothetical protein